jgi:hypothetical protein
MPGRTWTPLAGFWESGYRGERVVINTTSEIAPIGRMAEVAVSASAKSA